MSSFDFYGFFSLYFVTSQARCLLLGLLGEKDSVDVGEDSAGGDGDSAKKLVELLVVFDGKGEVPGDDPGLLVVAGGISSELEDLSGEVLEDGSEVDTSGGGYTVGVSSLLDVPPDTSDGELKVVGAKRQAEGC